MTVQGMEGVDVASFQGRPASWEHAAGPISWAAVKITELEPDGNHYVNPDAEADWAALHTRGRGRVAYMFGHPATQPRAAVDHFTANVRHLGLADQDAVALDIEVTDGLSAAQVSAWNQLVMSLLQTTFHRLPVIYTFLNFAREGNCQGLGHYPLWIADPSSPPGHPEVPAPWTTWAIHQYAIGGQIDRDIARYATRAAMATTLGKKYAAR